MRDSGAWLEDKEYAVAVHTRRLADPGQWASPIDQAARKIAEQYALEVIPGKLVWELRPPVHSDKGDAVRRVVAESGARDVVVVGDDLGDLPAFTAVPSSRAKVTRAAGGGALRGGSASAARRGRPHHRGAGRSPRLLAAACRLKARGPGRASPGMDQLGPCRQRGQRIGLHRLPGDQLLLGQHRRRPVLQGTADRL